MENQVISRHEYYSSSTRTTSFMSKESKSFVNGMFSTDSVDGCLENGHQRCVSFESKSYMTNGTAKSISETSYKEFSDGIEKKSFIQQRVERLYGPGALAQGFFVSRRQKDRLSESESQINDNNAVENGKHSKSMTDNLLKSEAIEENNLRQSISNPVLPVLRHLRPEFRAQLPIISPKKLPNTETKDDSLTSKAKFTSNESIESVTSTPVKTNISENVIVTNGETINDSCEKNGQYFLEIIEKETSRLLALADKIEKEERELQEVSEEIRGKLRAASGKARLLTSQKMQQFKGLCTKNITQNKSEAFPTTNEDLQGFWDMVMLQVDQVDALFKEIDILRQNDWKDPEILDSKTNISKSISKTRKIKNTTSSTASDELRKLKDAQRKKMIEERRKAMRENNVKSANSIEIFVAETS